MRLYVDLVPCLSYQTTENNSARELDVAGDEPDTQFRAAFTYRLRLYDVTRGVKVRACVDLFASFMIFRDCDEYTTSHEFNADGAQTTVHTCRCIC